MRLCSRRPGLSKSTTRRTRSLRQRKARARRARATLSDSGETLWAIALRHGVGLSALAQANGIDEPYRIYAGQKLRIPDGEAASTATGALRLIAPA